MIKFTIGFVSCFLVLLLWVMIQKYQWDREAEKRAIEYVTPEVVILKEPKPLKLSRRYDSLWVQGFRPISVRLDSCMVVMMGREKKRKH